MAKKNESTKNSAKRIKKSDEGEHGQRLNETRIDAEIASKTMEGSLSVPEDEAREAFEGEGQAPERDVEK